MTNDGHSGSRWEPGHGEGEAAMPAGTPHKRKRPLAALTAVGLVLVGGAGGWAIGTAVAGSDTPAVQDTGTPGGVPAPPHGGQRPDDRGNLPRPDAEDDDTVDPS